MMKRFANALFLFFCLVSLTHGAAAPVLQEGDKVAICGDSITEQKLYSVYMEDYFLMCQPVQKLEAIQFGWGGQTSWGFLPTMPNDVLPFKPTVATTCYGMNDGGYGPSSPERLAQYKTAMEGVVKTFKDAGVRYILVGSPGAVDVDAFRREKPGDAAIYNKTLSELRDVCKQVATEQSVGFADVHSTMYDAMLKAKAKYGKDYHVCGGDGVHPSQNGQLVMAYAFLKAMNFDGNIGTITLDLGENKAEATDGHKVLSVKDDSVEVESTRYPFCFQGDPANPGSTTGMIEFISFNEDLNRYRLIVKNAGAAQKLAVTWGKQTKEFAAADLEKGINLAAEFLDNPFVEPFNKVQGVINNQQNFETVAVKSLLHTLPDWNRSLPDDAETFARLSNTLVKKDEEARKASAAAVVPVKHVIQVKAVAP